jgi:L-threonylcarbamoyladenylate synthase
MAPLILRVDAETPDEALIARAASILQRGGIVAYPTDTLYGLAVDPGSDEAVGRLYQAKSRDAALAVPLIAGNAEQAFRAGSFSEGEARLARAFWPGPLSIVVPASPLLSTRLVAADATVAIRVPDHAVARALPLLFGGAVTATSANVSGAAPADNADTVLTTLGSRIDAIVDAGATHGGLPSTIVQVRNGVPRLLRAGAIPFDRVLEFCL